MEEPLVGGPVVGIEDVCAVVLDDPGRQAEPVEDGAHPLGVALGQVVVHGDDVDATPREPVQGRSEWRDERLALAGLHLRDAALVEHDAAHELDVEMAHPEAPPTHLAGGGEDLRDPLVERLAEGLEVPLAAFPGELPATLLVLCVELVLARLLGRCLFHDRIAQRGHPSADVLVGERLELGFEGVDLLDEASETLDLAFVGVDETVEDAEHVGSSSIGGGCLRSRRPLLRAASTRPRRSGARRER